MIWGYGHMNTDFCEARRIKATGCLEKATVGSYLLIYIPSSWLRSMTTCLSQTLAIETAEHVSRLETDSLLRIKTSFGCAADIAERVQVIHAGSDLGLHLDGGRGAFAHIQAAQD
jgi:hypothetical protein